MSKNSIDILLVEDNLNDIKLTLHAFKKHDFVDVVQVVRDGEEALDYLFSRGNYEDRTAESDPRLVLLDLKLPKVHGLEVLKILKEDVRTRHIPIVILTSSSEEKDIDKSYDLGVNSFIQKPVDFDKFVEHTRVLGLYWLNINKGPLQAKS
jgi:CheY-like chemotaxis protein